LTLGVRPEGLTIEQGGLPLQGSGRVYAIEPLGSDMYVDVAYSTGNGGHVIKFRTHPSARFEIGNTISVGALPSDIYLFDASGNRIFPAGGGK
jgi:ABC-type sugar transport system ATPase subunit